MGRRCSVILLGGTVSPEMGLRFPERVAPPHLGFTFLPLSQERFPMLRLPLQVGDGSHPLPTPGHARVWPDPAASRLRDSQIPLCSWGLAREAPGHWFPTWVVSEGENCLYSERSAPG